MTRREWIRIAIRQYPTMSLSGIKELVRDAEAEAEEELPDRIRRIRRDEGEWALRR